MSAKYYRADIDGLRAISVIGVILFHAGHILPGGYVGVDVFFVISGFLITQIIQREMAEGKFSLGNFWVRRIRRILPASTLVAAATVLVGMCVLDPHALKTVGQAAVAHAFMVANVYMWRSDGYFSESSDLQPLLHMWSLSVEEQFYLFYPFLLLLLFRFTSMKQAAVLFALALASLALSVYGVLYHPWGTFYLLPTRAWELLAGALAAMAAQAYRPSSKTEHSLGLLGLALVIVPMFVFTPTTLFPGHNAIYPVVGAMLLLLHPGAFFQRVLSCRPMVGIGLMSFSLYLWHWPVLVFRQHLLVDPGPTSLVVCIILTLVLSWLSWAYIENVFRNWGPLKRPARAYGFGIACVAVMLCVGSLNWLSNGLPGRFAGHMQDVLEDISWNGNMYEDFTGPGVAIGAMAKKLKAVDKPSAPVVAPPPEKPAADDAGPVPDFVLWGDSHGMVLAEAVDEMAGEMSLRGTVFVSPGWPTIPGLWIADKKPAVKEQMLAVNNWRLSHIIDRGIKNVLMVARWDSRFHGNLPTEIKGPIGPHNIPPIYTDSDEGPFTTETAANSFARQLAKFHAVCEQHDIKVWFLLKIPCATRPLVARDFYKKYHFPWLNHGDFTKDSCLDMHIERGQIIRQTFADLGGKQFTVVDASAQFFDADGCIQLYSERAHYRDEDHLTRYGVDFYLGDTQRSVLGQIKDRNGKP